MQIIFDRFLPQWNYTAVPNGQVIQVPFLNSNVRYVATGLGVQRRPSRHHSQRKR